MQSLQPDTSYHIFNHANGFENVFRKEENFYFFLEKYRLYISPIAETYAYCLMPNHFHLLVRTKSILEVSPAGETSNTRKSNPVSLAFQRFFTAYSQAINIQERRTGSLFEKPFKRLEISSTRQLANLVHYIHTNPQKHGITNDFRQYPWSSYERIIRDRPSKLKKEEVLNWFSNKENYVNYHARTIDLDELKDMIIE